MRVRVAPRSNKLWIVRRAAEQVAQGQVADAGRIGLEQPGQRVVRVDVVNHRSPACG